MSLIKLRKKLDSKEIGAVELTKEYLKKIKEKDTEINSFINVTEDIALENAKNAQGMIDKGEQMPMTGIPLAVKDNICTKGVITTCASKMLQDFKPVYDATVMEKLKKQGVVLLGKTNMDEFGMGSRSDTSYFGAVKNPFNSEYVAGGSSGGSAAAVSAGFVRASLGSDTGGSVRLPASFCGVAGLKPTYGAVSRYGLIAFASSLEQIGVIGKSAKDCAYILNEISGIDEKDGTTSKCAKGDYLSKIGMDFSGVKIGIPKEFFESDISEEVKIAVMDAAKFYEKKGAKLIDASIPSLLHGVPAYYLISSAEAASNLSRFDGIKYGYRSKKGESYEDVIKNTRGEAFGKEVKRRIMLGNYALSSGYYDEYYKNALKIASKIRNEYNNIFEEYDMLITPTSPTVAYKSEEKKSLSDMYMGDICTVTANIAGVPAISIPCGYNSEGLPIGMSITGRHFDEAGIVALADLYEEEFRRREPLI